jgi:MSHA biogenesis protein MshO
MMRSIQAKTCQRGFTLIEMIVVITITAIISAVVAVFLRAPIQGYFDASRRADLTDTADSAMRRISRDLHLALPNSVRVSSSGNPAIEFLQTRTGGRYRSATGTSTADNILDFSDPTDSSFELLGPALDLKSGDQIVVYNLGIPGADAYIGDNIRALAAAGVGITNTVQFVPKIPAAAFPFDSPNHSFQVVDTPVSYVCDLAAQTLARYWGYNIQAAGLIWPSPGAVGAGLQSAILAKNVTNCVFNYDASTAGGALARNGLVSIRITVGNTSENVTLYSEVHVSNVP